MKFNLHLALLQSSTFSKNLNIKLTSLILRFVLYKRGLREIIVN